MNLKSKQTITYVSKDKEKQVSSLTTVKMCIDILFSESQFGLYSKYVKIMHIFHLKISPSEIHPKEIIR